LESSRKGSAFAVLAGLALCGFAGNSLLCRMALGSDRIDPIGFTLLRLCAGAVTLMLLVGLSAKRLPRSGDWTSALALLGYALLFSIAYRLLTAGAGALFLFGSVQVTMIATALVRGERFNLIKTIGAILAAVGLLVLLLPRFGTPSAGASIVMGLSGVGWAVYTLRGRGATDPLDATAGNFLRAAAMVLIIGCVRYQSVRFDMTGAVCAVVSGALTSGIAYAIWYRVLREISRTTAATLQLSVPILTSLAAIPLLGESVTLNLMVSTALTLGGIALVIIPFRQKMETA
jgi:drug/metabolite transporter (DMT)-like permease